MKTFMEVCQNWGAEGCHPDISKWKSMEESEVKERIQLHSGKEKADEICKNCIALSFKECPDWDMPPIFPTTLRTFFR